MITEMRSSMDICPEFTRRILGSAIEVHRELGPGLLESTYRVCLVQQLLLDGHDVKQEVPIPVTYKGSTVDASFRADLIVDDSVLLELKAVEHLLPLHEARTLTYMRLCNLKIGLLINFNVSRLKDGVRRFVR
jgi:GxxExxY protein